MLEKLPNELWMRRWGWGCIPDLETKARLPTVILPLGAGFYAKWPY
jgi:hypothetical protein